MKALDLFCGAGGASYGLMQAGFEVTGVDIVPQKHYPFTFIQADALTFLLDGYDFVWASPPCQHYSSATQLSGTNHRHPDLVTPVRQRLLAWGGPYIIENVVRAPLRTMSILCGTMFGLKVYRHRLFESNLYLWQPQHNKHTEVIGCHRKNKRFSPNGFVSVTGHDTPKWRAGPAMGIDWMSGYELTQAIPPAYSKFLGTQVIEQLRRTAA